MTKTIEPPLLTLREALCIVVQKRNNVIRNLLKISKEFSDLDPQQKAKLINGCGTDTLHIKKSFFQEACEIHDLEYSPPFAGNKNQRKETDRRFLHNMLELVLNLPWHQKILRKTQAYVFYGCVRLLGHFFYNIKKKG